MRIAVKTCGLPDLSVRQPAKSRPARAEEGSA